MARIGSFKRITRENFDPEQAKLVEGLGNCLNNTVEELVRAVNGNLNDDNLVQKTKTVNLELNSSGVPKVITEFKTGLLGKLDGLQVIKAENLTNSAALPTGAPFITYTENGDLVRIRHVTGLPADNKYRLRIKIFGI